MGNILKSIKFKWMKEAGLTTLLISIIVLAFFAINLAVQKLDLEDIDLTDDQLYTITDVSKEQIAKIPNEEKIQIYLFNFVENSSVVDLAKQYAKANENITIEVTTVSNRKDIASKYEVQEGINTILIVSGEKSKIFTSSDLYIYDYNTGNATDITEERLTNGIIAVTSLGKTTPVYILTGHEEYSQDSLLMTLKTYLELDNYELKNLDLLVEENVPEDGKALIIASPQSDFKDTEVEKIKAYINRGGNILWMNDTKALKTSTPNIQKVLDLYGVTLHEDGVVFEQDSKKMAMQSPDIILPTINYSELTAKIAGNGTVMLLDASKLTFAEDSALEELGVTKTEILTTSDKAFYRTDLSIKSTDKATDKDEVGTFVVGATLEKALEDDKTSKLVIYANNAFATSAPMQIGSQIIPAIGLYNNLDIALDSVEYISEVEDQISIRKTVENTYYTATETEDIIIKVVIFTVPVIIILAGIVVWFLRRRKK